MQHNGRPISFGLWVAKTLANLARWHWKQREVQTATATFEKAIGILRQEGKPLPKEWALALAQTLVECGECLCAVGSALAIDRTSEAVAVLDNLDRRYPGRFRRVISRALFQLARLLAEGGDVDRAISYMARARALQDDLRKEFGPRFEREWVLVSAHAFILETSGDDRKTIAPMGDWLPALCRMAEVDPEEFSTLCAAVHKAKGSHHVRHQQTEEAGQAFEAAAQAYRRLSGDRGDGIAVQWANALRRAAFLAMQRGEQDAAQAKCQEAVLVLGNRRKPFRADVCIELAVVHKVWAGSLLEQEILPGALEHLREALALYREASERHSADRAVDMGVTLRDLAVVSQRLGRTEDVRVYATESLRYLQGTDAGAFLQAGFSSAQVQDTLLVLCGLLEEAGLPEAALHAVPKQLGSLARQQRVGGPVG